ncbi:methylmalonyl-CoA mutase family protein [Flavobacteriaceae bacterium]|nr:methylmalonyl-CoA mutase family protein [Flavobacteriaceae bacterium]
MSSNLFKEFDSISEKYWKQQIQFDLAGKDYNTEVNWTSDEGVNVKPFFTDKYKSTNNFFLPENWNISQEIYLNDEFKSNQEIKKLISQEVYDITIHIHKKNINLDLLFDDIDLTYLNIYFKIEDLSELILSKLDDYAKENKSLFHLDHDLLGDYLTRGNWKTNYKQEVNRFKDILNKITHFKSVVQLKSTYFQEAGANIIQQISYSMCQANEYINLFGKTIIKQLNFEIAIGSNYFFEIAKIQAFRILWKTISNTYDLPINNVHVIAIPTTRNKTIYDYNNNIIRSTSECMAAILGGANSIKNFNYDSIYKNKNEFSSRISINQLLILKHECHIDKVKNPISGSYYISYLVDEFAKKSFNLFKELDCKSSFLDHLKNGTIQRKIKENSSKEQENYNSKLEILVGSNLYVNMDEKMKQQLETNPFPIRKSKKTLIEPLIKKRLAVESEKIRLDNE